MTPWLFAAATFLLMLFMAFGTVRSGLILRDWLPPSNLLLSLPDNLLRLGLAGLCLWLGIRLGPGPAALVLAAGAVPEALVLGIASGVVLAAVLGLAGNLAVRRWGPGIYSNRLVQCILPARTVEWPGVLAAMFCAAALEELLFRWLPLAGFAWLVSPWWLLWPLAVFFGLLHWPQGWWGVAGTFLAAIYFSFLFLLTGSIWPPLIAHYLLNVSQLIFARAAGLRPLRG